MFYTVHARCNIPAGGGGGTPCSGLYREALPERGAFFKLAVY